MGLFRELAGEVRVSLTSADLSGAMAAVSAAGIGMKQMETAGELTVRFLILRRHYRKLRAIAAQRGDRLELEERKGLYWDIRNLRKRPVLLAGLALYLSLAVFVPSRVFLIEVQGNTSIPANRILETAEACGIRFGASRREVRSERVKNALLEAMPELAWAGVNTYGCRAVISVRQRDPEPEAQQGPQVSSIVAARDGYILSCDVVRGSGLCVPGQTVRTGEVLISGYTDCGICITATRAEGEVMAATSRRLTALTPSFCLKRGGCGRENTKYSLIVGKNRINFDNNSGISDASCGRMVTEYHLTLPGGCRLPVTLVKETFTTSDLSASEADTEELLKDFARRYLLTQMIAGTITGGTETVTEEEGVRVLTGQYACTEMIGRVRAEQNGELHETDRTNRQRGPGG